MYPGSIQWCVHWIRFCWRGIHHTVGWIDCILPLRLDPPNLNHAIKSDFKRPPSPEQISNKHKGGKILTIVDLSNYYQKLCKSSSQLCTFNTEFGRKNVNRLPYGASCTWLLVMLPRKWWHWKCDLDSWWFDYCRWWFWKPWQNTHWYFFKWPDWEILNSIDTKYNTVSLMIR